MAMGVWCAETRSSRKGLVLSLCPHHPLWRGLPRHQVCRVQREVRTAPRSRRRTSPSRSSSIHRPLRTKIAARPRHGREDADLFLALLRHDRHARPAHDHRHRPSSSGCSTGRNGVPTPTATCSRSNTSGFTGTSSILCGYSSFHCSTSSTGTRAADRNFLQRRRALWHTRTSPKTNSTTRTRKRFTTSSPRRPYIAVYVSPADLHRTYRRRGLYRPEGVQPGPGPRHRLLQGRHRHPLLHARLLQLAADEADRRPPASSPSSC